MSITEILTDNGSGKCVLAGQYVGSQEIKKTNVETKTDLYAQEKLDPNSEYCFWMPTEEKEERLTKKNIGIAFVYLIDAAADAYEIDVKNLSAGNLKFELLTQLKNKTDIKKIKELGKVGRLFLNGFSLKDKNKDLCVKFFTESKPPKILPVEGKPKEKVKLDEKTLAAKIKQEKVIAFSDCVVEYPSKYHQDRKNFGSTEPEKNPREVAIHVNDKKLDGVMKYLKTGEFRSINRMHKIGTYQDIYAKQFVHKPNSGEERWRVVEEKCIPGAEFFNEFAKNAHEEKYIKLMIRVLRELVRILAINQKYKIGFADLKWENILIKILPSGEVKVIMIDPFHAFGKDPEEANANAKTQEKNLPAMSWAEEIAMLPQGSVRSTTIFRCPADEKYTAKADIWSLAIMCMFIIYSENPKVITMADEKANPLIWLYNLIQLEGHKKLSPITKSSEELKKEDINNTVQRGQKEIAKDSHVLLQDLRKFSLKMFETCAVPDAEDRPSSEKLQTAIFDAELKKFPALWKLI